MPAAGLTALSAAAQDKRASRCGTPSVAQGTRLKLWSGDAAATYRPDRPLSLFSIWTRRATIRLKLHANAFR